MEEWKILNRYCHKSCQRRSDAYKKYDNFIRRLDKKGKCTSAQIKKKIVEIEQAEQKQEYAGVLLYFLKKKYHSLISRGL